ncbi:extensin family protein [Methylovirgula ligni]|uniref:Extensin-like C-terminal domain-containing protein n=2 Tax=Methylovirgula ligni TaxID=569860 RepID=A0A3D9YZL4_9HYPH|nr:extensin family protein [Methylovirgula ligni]REF86322.1 hypothetical protein DES32_2373 [Methylovirgula ligni]
MDIRSAILFALLSMALSCSAAKSDSSAPLPPPRPAGLSAPAAKPAALAVSPVATPDPACARVFASKRLIVAAAPPVSGPNGCGIAAPVTLKAVVLADGTTVPFEPPSLIRCDLAEALGDWVHDDVAPAVQPEGGLAKILGSVGYECRNRNHLATEKLSEHAKGNAVDLRGVVLRDGRQILIQTQAEKPAFLARLKASACARFRTVLGPGSDPAHALHLHVDLEQRRNNFRICEWNVN